MASDLHGTHLSAVCAPRVEMGGGVGGAESDPHPTAALRRADALSAAEMVRDFQANGGVCPSIEAGVNESVTSDTLFFAELIKLLEGNPSIPAPAWARPASPKPPIHGL